MCGINGIISNRFDRKNRELFVNDMNSSMIYRGPDESGFFSDEKCTLAMRRLAIIDLNSGAQPIWNEDKSIAVILNGEIYNFLELKELLKKKNHHFYTKSDTEVIVHLYEEFGEGFIPMLKGMFAFCIYNLKESKWLLARDRFGEKPLFYYQKEGYLSFSSEINSLLKDKNIRRVLNLNVLDDYISNGIVAEPQTLLNDIYSLEPGHFLSIQDSKVSIKEYFKLNYDVDNSIKDTEECLELIRPVLIKAVKSQMVSDVSFGAFLSGGIDSSSIVSLLQQNSDKQLKTFTVKFDNVMYDESSIAKEVSRRLGTNHNEIFIKNKGFTEEIFWIIIKHVGFPFPDSSAIPTYLICKEIGKEVKVAISGDGGDELFAGYPFYSWWPKIAKIHKFPDLMKKGAVYFLDKAKLTQTFNGRTVQRALLASLGSENEIGARASIIFTELELLFLTNGRKSDFSRLSQFPESSDSWEPLHKALYYRLKNDLPLDMLVKVDRMSMANSLEVRAPFLDVDLFDCVSKIPLKFLMQNGKPKFLLRKLMENQLPQSVFDHPKSGFSIPLHDYFNEDFILLCKEFILNNTKMHKIFNLDALRFFVNRGLNQKQDTEITVYRSSHQLWSLLQLGGWLNYFDVDVEG